MIGVEKYDIVIVGAGVAGLSAASALARKKLKVAILDKGIEGTLKTGECLMADALSIMDRLGLKQEFLKQNHRALQSYKVAWGEEEPYERHLISSPTGEGWIVDRKKFDAMLVAECKTNGVDFYWESSLLEVKETETDWDLEIRTNSPKRLTARFVIDASGRSGVFARRIGMERKKMDQLVASYCHLENSGDQSFGSATIASEEGGWWYYANYSDSTASLCYFSDADLPIPKNPELLLQKAQKHSVLNPLIKEACTIDSTFTRCSADSSALKECVGNKWLAIGDAATSFDPLSSYGMTSALSGAFYASQAILLHFKGEKKYLQTYQQLIQENYMNYLSKRLHEYEKVKGYESDFWSRRTQDYFLKSLESV